ncbi:MAG: hypothetical protein CL846_10275 [Crocinitomicaceae bacterium]|nr:hypothetical protein [Crocinitomicaceae bacterium]|tara:strand:- start:1427 stop:1909 length:483 start_codon:yes stop_codon:yes gene_type:complete
MKKLLLIIYIIAFTFSCDSDSVIAKNKKSEEGNKTGESNPATPNSNNEEDVLNSKENEFSVKEELDSLDFDALIDKYKSILDNSIAVQKTGLEFDKNPEIFVENDSIAAKKFMEDSRKILKEREFIEAKIDAYIEKFSPEQSKRYMSIFDEYVKAIESLY